MSAGNPSKRQTAQEVYDALRDEWEALGAVSYHGSPWSENGEPWMADLGKEDVEKIRGLLADAASTIEAFS